jgi:serine/threonine protein kinase/tetratricopeptide (TPR) repeat protein
MIGSTISHYRILEKLGEGGMGVVYTAQDTTLDRRVALKFLPVGVKDQSLEKARFLQEARAAATLNHPNICTIHEIGDVGGEQFIVMELVDGKTLRQLSPVRDVKTAVSYAIQIGEGLQEAHRQGIIHRDIKADNIMLNSRNQIKVMDFGLAKLRGSVNLTRSSSTLGTLAYMAPEQLQGAEADVRADIFSFGAVLYEMFTGKTPFRGEHEAAMVYSILNEQPAPLTGMRPDLSPDVDRIVRRALEKNPAERYQHVDDMVVDLRRLLQTDTGSPAPLPPTAKVSRVARRGWIGIAALIAVLAIGGVAVYRIFSGAGGPSAPARKMLVVLPFENLGPSDQEYFADGITEEITSRLSGLSGLGVIARSSAMQYKKTAKSVKQVGEELGVSYVLQGTIRWEGTGGETRVRVTPQLVSVNDGTQIWSEPFESVLSGAFKLQSEIAGNVAHAMDLKLLQPERTALVAVLTTNPEAYDQYLRGLNYSQRSFAEKDMRIAQGFMEKAIQLDPGFAAAYAQVSALHSNMYWEFYEHTEERRAEAKRAAEKALELDPALPVAHVAMGLYYYHCLLDYDNALKEAGRALEFQPNDRDALAMIAAVQRRQGKYAEAASNFSKVVVLDPRAADMNVELGITLAKLRSYPEAERCYDRAIDLSPDWGDAYVLKAQLILQWNGDTKKARAVLDDAAAKHVPSSNPLITWGALSIDYAEGRYEDALKRLSAMDPPRIDHQEYFIPVEIFQARTFGLMKRTDRERSAYESAREILEREAKNHPDDSRVHGSLGIAYAGLGRKADAVREGRKAVELMPISHEALRGAYRAEEYARICMMVGDDEAAVTTLEQLLSMPSDLSAVSLRLDPTWAPLRSNPGFKKFVGPP